MKGPRPLAAAKPQHAVAGVGGMNGTTPQISSLSRDPPAARALNRIGVEPDAAGKPPHRTAPTP